MTDHPTTEPTPKQVALGAATFLLHAYSAGLHDMRPALAQALVKAVTVALTMGEWKPDVKYDVEPVDHPLRYATTTPDGQVAAGLASDEGDQTWRGYTIEPVSDETVVVLCRSDDACESELINGKGKHLTLGEAVDWAKEHAAAHDHDREIEERAAREDALRAGLGSAYYNLPYPIADKAPWNGQPMTAVEYPADGTQTEPSSEPRHGRTSHGHPCCGKAPSERPNAIARCGGVRMCKVCAAERDVIHGASSDQDGTAA